MRLLLENVSRVYKMGSGDVHALNKANFKVESNEFVAIMGPSGSGKSTLMNILGCLDRPTAGRYLIDDINISALHDRELTSIRNQKIGFVFQSFNLLPRMTVLKNVELPLIYAGYPRGKRRLKIAQASLDSVGLANLYHHKPNELSGGQQQRVAIARSLVTDPHILLADEPTGSLDSSTGEDIMKIFCNLNQKGKIIILVTHEKSIAQYAHRIVELRDGMVNKGA